MCVKIRHKFGYRVIYATHILERAGRVKRDADVNKPQSPRDCNENPYTARLPTPDAGNAGNAQ